MRRFIFLATLALTVPLDACSGGGGAAPSTPAGPAAVVTSACSAPGGAVCTTVHFHVPAPQSSAVPNERWPAYVSPSLATVAMNVSTVAGSGTKSLTFWHSYDLTVNTAHCASDGSGGQVCSWQMPMPLSASGLDDIKLDELDPNGRVLATNRLDGNNPEIAEFAEMTTQRVVSASGSVISVGDADPNDSAMFPVVDHVALATDCPTSGCALPLESGRPSRLGITPTLYDAGGNAIVGGPSNPAFLYTPVSLSVNDPAHILSWPAPAPYQITEVQNGGSWYGTDDASGNDIPTGLPAPSYSGSAGTATLAASCATCSAPATLALGPG
ncbi:MAG: hypothetical protein ACLPYS_16185 [Vulcanimicrobiaceae bacterium]